MPGMLSAMHMDNGVIDDLFKQFSRVFLPFGLKLSHNTCEQRHPNLKKDVSNHGLETGLRTARTNRP